MPVHATEWLLALFASFGDKSITNDHSRLHYAFWKVRKELPFELPFKMDVLYPVSQRLDELLWSLRPYFLEFSEDFGTFRVKRERVRQFFEKSKLNFDEWVRQVEPVSRKLEPLITIN